MHVSYSHLQFIQIPINHFIHYTLNVILFIMKLMDQLSFWDGHFYWRIIGMEMYLETSHSNTNNNNDCILKMYNIILFY